MCSAYTASAPCMISGFRLPPFGGLGFRSGFRLPPLCEAPDSGFLGFGLGLRFSSFRDRMPASALQEAGISDWMLASALQAVEGGWDF